MLVAINDSGERVIASDATKDKKYYCPVCNENLILKQGKVTTAHFAHMYCKCIDNWQYDMSEWHINMQSYFDKMYQEVVLTRDGKKHRADILKDGIAIEFQHSPISSKEFMDRNDFYVSVGLKVIWVFDVSEQIEKGKLEWNHNKYNMMKWKQPLKILWNTNKPNRKNDVLICLNWYDEDDPEYEKIYRIDWSSISDNFDEDECYEYEERPEVIEYPDYKNIVVSEPFILEKDMDLKQFFYSESQVIESRLKRLAISYKTVKTGEKGLSRDAYICPKTKEFGIELFKKCQYCLYFYDYSKYGQTKFNCYCCYPKVVNDRKNMHP